MGNKHPLYTQVQQGESKTLEFKQQLPQHAHIAKTLIAFANTAGGKLIIGVDDKRQLIGLAEQDIFTLKDTISSLVHDLCSPTLLPEIYIENVNGIELLVIQVSRGALLPYYLKHKGKQAGCYIRLNASNRLADAERINELERQRLNISYDEQIDYEVALNSIDLSPLQARFHALGKPLDDKKLRNLKLIKEEQGTSYPTKGLLILLGYYKHVEIKCARFKGNTMSLFLDKKEYQGDIFEQLEQAEAFIKNHLHLRAEVLGLQRTDTYELPIPAIREALLNAVMHRDYSNQGRDIKIGIYDDILNIVSPGGLPNGLTLEDVYKGRSEIRNSVVARVFKALNLVEEWGSGIQRIKDYCQASQLAEPRFTESGDFSDWEFPRPIQVKGTAEEQVSGEMSGEMSGENPDTLLAIIASNPSITIPQLAKQFNNSTRTIERKLKLLQENEQLRRIGSTKSGHWQVLDD